jgi:hypothetical protein
VPDTPVLTDDIFSSTRAKNVPGSLIRQLGYLTIP